VNYDIYNPTSTPRIIYDGIEGSQRALRLDPGGRLINVPLGQGVVDMLRSRDNDVQLFVRGQNTPLTADAIIVAGKPPIVIDGMWGIGDNLHQRAPIRELMKTHEVWLYTCHAAIWHDLIPQGLHLVRKTTRLRTQAKILEREKLTFPNNQPPTGISGPKIWYRKDQIDIHGSIVETLMHECGIKGVVPDFSMPVKREWVKFARDLMATWDMQGKPLMIYRPIVQRREWNGANRNPDPVAYEALYKSIKDKFFTVSIADLQANEEWIVGPEQDADVKIHDGSLMFETIAGLFKEAQIIFCNAGFAPVLAQAVGTPVIVVYGGRESYKTTQRAGAHLAPTLGIDPIHPCDCHVERHECKKEIDIPAAIEKLVPFAEKYSSLKPKVLIFATTYVDSQDRVKLTDHWITLTKTLNPDCDLLIVDSASPIQPFIDTDKHGVFTKYGVKSNQMLHDFGNNVGHLSRKGKDGWGRAFTFGLQAAVDSGYDYVAHIEGDSLFRLPVMDIAVDMRNKETKVASIPVIGMKGGEYPRWVETGLMFFDTKYIAESDFIKKYDWPNRRESPTPEIVVRELIEPDLVMMPWKGIRGDKAQVTHLNVVSMNLDWVTHCHNDSWVYDKYIKHVLGGEPESKPTVKLNLGCGDNKLDGWENHDADVDITKKLPYDDDSVDFVFCEHCVEHIPYPSAVEFFKECHRILKPGGTVRITVPSIEQIYKNNDPDYWKFTTKFQPENSKRGALANIMFKHGHQVCWTSALMEAALFYSGFEMPVYCETHKSPHPELTNVEGHHKVIGDKFNLIESMSYEGTKYINDRIAVVVGGGKDVMQELDQAKALCGKRADFFVINDMIPQFTDEATAITLHPSKLDEWTKDRKGPSLRDVWSHRPHSGVTKHVEDDGGSSGLFAVKVARHLNYNKIILCGVPMTPDADHFVRKVSWNACPQFRKAWDRDKEKYAPYVRSYSGWTAETFGTPTEDFIV